MKSSIRSIAARVFTHPKYPKKGGNPVTIFVLPPPVVSPPSSLSCAAGVDHSSAALRKNLAQSCSWESVIVDYGSIPTVGSEENNTNSIDSLLKLQPQQQQQPAVVPPRLHFYMPSGEEVSFCAHAAMGAAMVMYQDAIKEDRDTTTTTKDNKEAKITFQTCDGVHHTATILHGQRVELTMTKHDFKENHVDDQIVAKLLNLVGLKMEHVTTTIVQGGTSNLPNHHHIITETWKDLLPLVNSSVSRYKTLVPIQTLDILHSATNPKDADEFRTLCDLIGSTGLYLYTPVSSRLGDGMGEETTHECDHGRHRHRYELECRQFPRASGYPEDSATGIAAAALACSLYKWGMGQGEFIVNQGTAMKRPSRCFVKVQDDDEFIFCSGSVEMDGECEWWDKE